MNSGKLLLPKPLLLPLLCGVKSCLRELLGHCSMFQYSVEHRGELNTWGTPKVHSFEMLVLFIS